jgi:hypothetical protein
MSNIDVTQEVQDREQLRIYGPITPKAWRDFIGSTNSKGEFLPNRLAIDVLSDICYWYLPIVKEDSQTGKLLSKHKKFRNDYLQKSYEHYSQELHASKKKIQRALRLLEKMKLIERIFRSEMHNGILCHNVMYIKPVFSEITKITYPDKLMDKNVHMDTGVHKAVDTSVHTNTIYYVKPTNKVNIDAKSHLYEERDAKAHLSAFGASPSNPSRETATPTKKTAGTKLTMPDSEIHSEIIKYTDAILLKEKELLQQQGITMKPIPAFSRLRGIDSKTFELLKVYIKQLQEGTFILNNTASPEYEKQYGDKVLRYRNMTISSILDSIYEMMERYVIYRLKTPGELRKNRKVSITQFLYDADTSHVATVPSYFRHMHVVEVGVTGDAPQRLNALKTQISAFGDEDINGDSCIRALFPQLSINDWTVGDQLYLYQSIYNYFSYVMGNPGQFNPRNRVGMLYRACKQWREKCEFYDIAKCKKLPACSSEFMQKYYKEWLTEIERG